LTASVNAAPADPAVATGKAALIAEIAELQQNRENLIKELANLKPTGDPGVDGAWRAGIRTRFAAIIAEQRTKKQLLAEIVREEQMAAPVDIDVLDVLPEEEIDLIRLPEDQQRRIYDAFHLDMRYNAITREVSIRVTITGDTAPALAATVQAILEKYPETKNRGPEQ
jgi:hypothetical protein